MSENPEIEVEQPQSAEIVQEPAMTPDEALDHLRRLRFSTMPILETLKQEYENRVRPGYPTLVDNVDHGGVFGINFDPGFGIFFMTDGSRVFAELHRVDLRTEALSAANYEKFSGRPAQQEFSIDVDGDAATQARKLISLLLHAWVNQQTFKYRVDS